MILAGLGGVYAIMGGDLESGDAARDNRADGVSSAVVPAPGRERGTRDRPVLSVADASAEASGEARGQEPEFDAEPRQPAWAGDWEPRIDQLVRNALEAEGLADAARIGAVDCRTWRCRFPLVVLDAARFADVVAVLEDERGLRHEASSMRLSNMSVSAIGLPTGATVTLVFDDLRSENPRR